MQQVNQGGNTALNSVLWILGSQVRTSLHKADAHAIGTSSVGFCVLFEAGSDQ